jgi:hypothetical protein
MRLKLIFSFVGIIVLGTGLFIWKSESALSITSSSTRPSDNMKVTLVRGGNFSSESYSLDERILTHTVTARTHNAVTVPVTNVSLDVIAKTIAEYKLDEIKNDPPGPPDSPFAQLHIEVENKTYNFYCVIGKDTPCARLSEALIGIFQSEVMHPNGG